MTRIVNSMAKAIKYLPSVYVCADKCIYMYAFSFAMYYQFLMYIVAIIWGKSAGRGSGYQVEERVRQRERERNRVSKTLPQIQLRNNIIAMC